MSPSMLGRYGGLAAMIGGLLWVPYSIFEMLEPWGAATLYREDLGYQLITNTPLFVAYSLPGSLAVLLISLGMLATTALPRPLVGCLSRAGLILTYVAVGLGILSLAGVIALFAPLFFAGLVFGSAVLGAATLLAGIGARRASVPSGWPAALLVLGLMGLFMLPLRPLVYAVALVPNSVGAAFMGLFGLGWVALGFALWSHKPR